jgi:peptidyl-prolyl cis-trans isomerase C
MKYYVKTESLNAFGVPGTKGLQINGDVVAKIDDEVITIKDVERELSTMPAFAREFFKGQEGMTRLVDELVKKDLLYVEAKKMGLDKEEDFRRKPEEIKKNALITRLLEVRNATSQVTDKEVEDYYNSHKDEFVQPVTVRVSQIVVRTEDDSKKVYQRLQNNEPFARLAAEVSIERRSANSGGDLGTFKRGEMNQELEKVAFRLKKNQISMPVPLGDGLHILAVTDIKGAAHDFNSVKGGLRKQLMAKKQQEGLDQFIEGLKKTHAVEINKDSFAKIKTPGGETSAPVR